MKLQVLTALFVIAIATEAAADLKPDMLDCNPKKVARNAALDATVGTSGRCNPGKAADKAREHAAGHPRDTVDPHGNRKLPLDRKDKGDGVLKKNKD